MTRRAKTDERDRASPILVVAISVALSVVGTLLLVLWPFPMQPPTAGESGLPRLKELGARITALEDQARARRANPDGAGVTAPQRHSIGHDGEAVSLESLETRLAALEHRVRPRTDLGGNPTQPTRSDASEKTDRALAVTRAKNTITDPAASVADKLRAHVEFHGPVRIAIYAVSGNPRPRR